MKGLLGRICFQEEIYLIKSTPDKNEIVKDAIQFLVNQFINNGNIENKDILSLLINLWLKKKLNQISQIL